MNDGVVQSCCCECTILFKLCTVSGLRGVTLDFGIIKDVLLPLQRKVTAPKLQDVSMCSLSEASTVEKYCL